MRLRLAASILMIAMAAAARLQQCSAQTAPSKAQWDEKFNSPGTKLTYREISRASIQGRTVITYSLFASGLPKDQHYVFWVLNLGSDPQAVADAYLNEEGKVVNALADPEHHVPEDPINAKVAGGKGEPIRFALISDEGDLRAFAQIVPFPIEKTSGPCHLSAIETGPYYFGMFIAVTGFQPNEELSVEQHSENEGAKTTAKADSQGMYKAALFPFVKGKRSGKARFYVTANSCTVGIEFPWGEGSYQYQ